MLALARYGHTLRFYIRPHFAKRPPVATLKLRFVPVAAARPTGSQKRPYAKWPTLGPGASTVGACRSHPRPTRRRLGTLFAGVAPWHQSVRYAQFSSQWPAASHRVSAPPAPSGCAACPVRPHGAPTYANNAQRCRASPRPPRQRRSPQQFRKLTAAERSLVRAVMP